MAIQENIHDKGFNFSQNKIKINNGSKAIEDAILDLASVKNIDSKRKFNKNEILKALMDRNVKELRNISQKFNSISGIYSRGCRYLSSLYRYDWYIEPQCFNKDVDKEKFVKDTYKAMVYFDNSQVPKVCDEIAQKVVVYGAYYGYLVKLKDRFMLQELPVNYCRSRFFKNGHAVVEFNMKFFDESFSDPVYRLKVLKLFPDEFIKGYSLYKQGKLIDVNAVDALSRHETGWFQLNTDNAFKFNLTTDCAPPFVNAIPAIIDLDAAQELDKKKQMQDLLKIIIQELPRDKNGDLIFDVDEALDLHNNAVQMVGGATGVDVLTTFAEIKSIDLADKNTSTTRDDLAKMERAVFNAFGFSQNLFNTDGNLSLSKSILNDVAAMRPLLLQLEDFFQTITTTFCNNRNYNFRFHMLETTQDNYQELAKLYREQTQLGNSKMMPQIALGHSQSSILNLAYFENEVLDLSSIMIPPLSSNTINGEDILNRNKNSDGGRPELPEDQKSEKTIQNEESMS